MDEEPIRVPRRFVGEIKFEQNFNSLRGVLREANGSTTFPCALLFGDAAAADEGMDMPAHAGAHADVAVVASRLGVPAAASD